jgi:hypothetical protein
LNLFRNPEIKIIGEGSRTEAFTKLGVKGTESFRVMDSPSFKYLFL